MTNEKYLSEQQISELHAAFNLFDSDNDGSITPGELSDVMSSLGTVTSAHEIQDMVEEFDEDEEKVQISKYIVWTEAPFVLAGNGTIEFDEFMNLMYRKMKETESQGDLRHAFRVLDQDQDGLITPAELRHVLTKLGELLTVEEVGDMVRIVDEDGDGRINFREFMKIVNSSR